MKFKGITVQFICGYYLIANESTLSNFLSRRTLNIYFKWRYETVMCWSCYDLPLVDSWTLRIPNIGLWWVHCELFTYSRWGCIKIWPISCFWNYCISTRAYVETATEIQIGTFQLHAYSHAKDSYKRCILWRLNSEAKKWLSPRCVKKTAVFTFTITNFHMINIWHLQFKAIELHLGLPKPKQSIFTVSSDEVLMGVMGNSNHIFFMNLKAQISTLFYSGKVFQGSAWIFAYR